MRGKSRAVLLALAVAVLAPSLGIAQYTPKWHVGDWWIVKEWGPNMIGEMVWEQDRYDVLGTERIGGVDCFVLQVKLGDATPSRDGARDLYYVRADNYSVVRVEMYSPGKLTACMKFDCPEGVSGPTPLHPRLPVFPLGLGSVQDSTFHDSPAVASRALLRQFSGRADSALLKRFRGEPNPSGGSPLEPRDGQMFSATSEMGVSRDGFTAPSVYSLQLWSTDYPWRLYEEQGQYAPDGTRTTRSRSWLVACGRSGSR